MSNSNAGGMEQALDSALIERIRARAGIDSTGRVSKIEIGFSNDVYSIGDDYILKAARCDEDDEGLKREVYLCEMLKPRVPAPEVVWSDLSRTLTGRVLIVYRRIPGHNLYEKWHLYSDKQRRELVGQICDMLRSVNQTPYAEFARSFDIDTETSWQERICSRIRSSIKLVRQRGILPVEVADETTNFLEQNGWALGEQRMALTYHDPHFDNFIVEDAGIVGMLDFERTDVTSTDYVLDLVRRMVAQPTKYASTEFKKLVKPEDYSRLLQWYAEFYPELFEFAHMNMRLALYSIEHSLNEILCYPTGTAARKELLESLHASGCSSRRMSVTKIHEANRTRWNANAQEWKRLRDEDGWRPRCPSEPHLAFEGRALETILELAGELRGKNACVVGSGDNYAAFALAGLGMEVTSVDISEEQLKDAAEHASDLGLDIRFVRADAANMRSLAVDSFDLVCSTNGFLIWLADLSVVFAEIARILRPGGHYVFYDVHPFQRPWKDQVAPIEMIKPYGDRSPNDHCRGETHWTFADILEALIESGLDVRRIVETAAANSRFWEGPSYAPGMDESLQDWKHNPRAGLPVWLTVAAVKR